MYTTNEHVSIVAFIAVIITVINWVPGPGPSLVGDRLVHTPRLRNSLLAPLRDTNSIYSFIKQLNTHLFSGDYVVLHVTYL